VPIDKFHHNIEYNGGITSVPYLKSTELAVGLEVKVFF